MSDFLFYISLRSPSVETRRASSAACNFAKQQNCTVRILRALSLTPTPLLRATTLARPPPSIFAPAKKSSVSWWLSHHPRALFPTANPIPRAPSFRGLPPPSPLREPSPRFSHPFANLPAWCRVAVLASSDGRARGKIIYKRQNSAGGKGGARFCGLPPFAKSCWDVRGIHSRGHPSRDFRAETEAYVISRPAGIEGVIYEHETAESGRKRDRGTLETTGGAEY